MPLVIPDGYTNAVVTINNTAGGLSGKSSIALGLDTNAGLDETAITRIANIFRDDLRVGWDAGWTVGPVKFYTRVGTLLIVREVLTLESGTAGAAVYATPAVSIVVSKSTLIAGRPYRGRFYLPGAVETSVFEDGTLDVGYQATWQGFMDTLHTDLVADAAIDTIVLFHDETSPESTPSTVFSFLVRGVVGTMRPRQRR